MAQNTLPSSGDSIPGGASDAGEHSEETPLLASKTGVQASGADDEGIPEDSPRHVVGPVRAASIAVGMFALVIISTSNMSGMTMAQSSVAADLDAYASATWFTSLYLITASSFTPLLGRLVSVFSPTSLVLPTALCMALGSLVSALAPSLWIFLAGRVLLGIGGAGVTALCLALILELVSHRRRGLWLGFMNVAYTTGMSSGAVIFGSLLLAVGWRALLWAQAPLAICGGLAIYLGLPASLSHGPTSAQDKTKSNWQKAAGLDYLGAFSLTISIVLFLYGLSGGIRPKSILLSLAVLVFFIVVEFFAAADPIIPLSVLSSRSILLSCLAQLTVMSARWTILFFTPILALAVRGLRPSAAGSLLIPTNLGFALGSVLVGWIHVRRAGPYWLSTIVSTVLFAISLYAMSAASAPSTALSTVVAAIFANGAAAGAVFTYSMVHAIHHSHADAHFVTTSLISTFRSFGGSFGTGIGGGIFARLLQAGLLDGFSKLDGGSLGRSHKQLAKKLVGSPALVFSGQLGDADKTVAIWSYAGAARGVFQAATLVAVVAILVHAGTGWKSSRSEGEQSRGDCEETVSIQSAQEDVET